MKIAFGMIVFEGDYVLKQCLEQVYPFATQILISEGPVEYWQQLGKKTSEDDTNKILEEFPDPDGKITIVHGQFKEKDEQCRAYMPYLRPDIDYIWNLDSDEVYRSEDIIKMIDFLSKVRPTSVGVQSCSFYGGFDNYLTGFELNTDNFLRIFRVVPGCNWATHRPPTIHYPVDSGVIKSHVPSDWLFKNLGVQMYHYSYVFPDQVYKKISYYKAKISRDICIDDYFEQVYLPWVIDDSNRDVIEQKYFGVHEFKPQFRGPCFSTKFSLSHPEAIVKDMEFLKNKFQDQLKKYIK